MGKSRRMYGGFGLVTTLMLSVGVLTGSVEAYEGEVKDKVVVRVGDVGKGSEEERLQVMNRYNEKRARIQPAYYEKTNGYYQKNKVYFGSLIERQLKDLRDYQKELGIGRQSSGDAYIVGKEKEIKRLVEKFKKSPGIVPNVIGFTDTDNNADKYGVSKVTNEFFKSKWNSATVKHRGVFSKEKDKSSKVFGGDKTVFGERWSDSKEGVVDELSYVEYLYEPIIGVPNVRVEQEPIRDPALEGLYEVAEKKYEELNK